MKEQGRTIIFSTHNMASVEEICDEIALIDRSQVVLSGNVAEVRERFRTNTFKVQLKEETIHPDSELFSVISMKQGQSSLEVMLRKNESVSNKDLLASLLNQYELVGFSEELPSMNEIFINTVSGSKNPQV